MFCKYKYIFGKVGEGAHSYRIYDIAIVDVLLTLLLGLFIHMFFSKYKYIYIVIFLFILGIILHRMFCVRTTIDKILFN
jgi:hypothetical protein